MAKKIIGVETVDEAINDAKENAALNNISHASFFAGDVIDICNHDFFARTWETGCDYNRSATGRHARKISEEIN